MTAILGISAFYHDAAAALVVDGRIVAAAQEERFTRRKHDASFPRHAVDYCLRPGGLTAAQLKQRATTPSRRDDGGCTARAPAQHDPAGAHAELAGDAEAAG